MNGRGDVDGASLEPAWQRVAGCDVLLPPRGEKPRALLHFVGGAVAGAVPQVMYHNLLERLAEEASAAIVATPYQTTFDLAEATAQTAASFSAALGELAANGHSELDLIPLYGVGHGLGAVVALLIAAEEPAAGHRQRAGTISISFTLRPPTDALPLKIPYPSLPPSIAKPAADIFRAGATFALNQDRLEYGLRATSSLASLAASVLSQFDRLPREGIFGALGSLRDLGVVVAVAKPEQVAAVLAQPDALVGVLVSLGDGRELVKPPKKSIAASVKRARAQAPRLLLVDFCNDSLDETPWVLQALGCKMERPEAGPYVDDEPWRSQLDDELDRQLESELESYGEWDESFAEVEEAEAEEFGSHAVFEEVPPPSPPPSHRRHADPTQTELAPDPGPELWTAWPAPPAVERVRLQGDHATPLGLSDEGEATERLERLGSAIARFVRGEVGTPRMFGIVFGGGFALKAKLLRLLAGVGRTSRYVDEILPCVRELEAFAPVSDVPDEGQGPLVSEALIGSWRLLWTSAPEVSVLLSLPIVDCGEIRQDVPPQSLRPGEAFEVVNSVEFSSRGAALLSLAPSLVESASFRLTLRALATPCWGNNLSLRVVEACVEPVAGGGPVLPLPVLPAVQQAGERVDLVTTFLDSEVRISRSLLGDAYVWLKVD